MITRARVGRREVPRRYWRLDGYPIRVHEDSEPNTHVNLSNGANSAALTAFEGFYD